jgi:diguanylate cyclase (GGDEF)-like protein
MDSKAGLIIQFSGILLIAVLSFFLTRSLKSNALKYWKYGWFSLSLSLFSLYVALSLETNSKFFYVIYYLGEYVFVYLLIAGCRSHEADAKITARSWLWLIPGLSAAFLLAFSISSFNEVFNFHSFIMGAAFAIAFFSLNTSGKLLHDNFGWNVMKIALAMLALNFFHYTLIFSLLHISAFELLEKYVTFNSVINLVMEVLLGFGMVIVLLEKVRLDAEEANHKLKEAHDKLEQLAHIDPLTTAFTRHAFYSFLQKHNVESGSVSGCVGVFDIDNLKPINDRFGHAAGDIAISSVAHAIRSLVRADDLIFRWGGDEFFVVMLGFETKQASERMSELNSLLKDIKLSDASERMSVGVSYGFADFSDIMNVENCIKQADTEMYRAKQQNKSPDKTANINYLPPETIISEPSVEIH